MDAELPLIALWIALLVLGLGFFIRSSAYFSADLRHKQEFITVLREIRDALKKG